MVMRKGCGLSSGRAVRRAAFTALEALESRRLMSAGNLDTTFGAGAGYVTTSFDGASDDSAFAEITDHSGKLVVVGFSNNGATIVRYNTNGSRDTTFGSNGAAYIDSAKMGVADAIVEDSSNRYIIGGQNENHDGTFVRLNSNG